jgi:hypothetical protein
MKQALGCALAFFLGLFAFVGFFWLAWQLMLIAVVGVALAVAWRLFRGR